MIKENTPLLQTERLILRKYEQKDVQALFEILSDIEVNTFLPWFPLKSIGEAEDYLQERFISHYGNESGYHYAICKKESNVPIGYICLSDNDSHDFGYGLKKEYWHKGIVTEAGKAVVQQIKNAGYLYITATHDKNNPHSGGVMKNLGMKYQYSYIEQWQPKNISVTFRMYQLNFDDNNERIYKKYWNDYENHFIEENI